MNVNVHICIMLEIRILAAVANVRYAETVRRRVVDYALHVGVVTIERQSFAPTIYITSQPNCGRVGAVVSENYGSSMVVRARGCTAGGNGCRPRARRAADGSVCVVPDEGNVRVLKNVACAG